MIRISVNFDAKINFRWEHCRYRLIVSLREGGRKVYLEPNPEKTAYLINRYGCNLTVQAFGYTVELPENAVLALKYLSHVEETPLEELDEIVKTGKTEIHKFMEKLGFNISSKRDLGSLFKPLEMDGGAAFSLSLSHFPLVFLRSKNHACSIRFNAKEVNGEFLRRVFRDEVSEDEYEMLRGISLLGEKAQRRQMWRLSDGELTKDKLAKTLFRAASSSKVKRVWGRIVEWLRRNGYEKYAGQIIVKKTLM